MPEQFDRPQGETSKGASNLADKGTKTGVTDTYGADLSGTACNCESGSSKGDFMMPTQPGGGCNGC